MIDQETRAAFERRANRSTVAGAPAVWEQAMATLDEAGEDVETEDLIALTASKPQVFAAHARNQRRAIALVLAVPAVALLLLGVVQLLPVRGVPTQQVLVGTAVPPLSIGDEAFGEFEAFALDPNRTFISERSIDGTDFRIIWNLDARDELTALGDLPPPTLECGSDALDTNFPSTCLDLPREVISDFALGATRVVERQGEFLETTATIAVGPDVLRVVGRCDRACVMEVVLALRTVDGVPVR